MLLNSVWKLTRNSVRVPSASKRFDFLTGIGLARYPACQTNWPALDFSTAGFLCIAAFLGSLLFIAKAEPLFLPKLAFHSLTIKIPPKTLLLLACIPLVHPLARKLILAAPNQSPAAPTRPDREETL